MRFTPIITASGPILSNRKTQERLDLCNASVWKLEKLGLLEGVLLYSKKYYTLESIERFEQRVLAGEFASVPRGVAARAAGRAAAKRKAQAEAPKGK